MTSFRAVSMVAGREMAERIRSKALLVTTVITILVVIAAVVLPQIIFDETEQFSLGVVGAPPSGFEAALTVAAVGRELEVEVTSFDSLIDAEQALESGDIDAVADFDAGELVVSELPDGSLEAAISSSLQQSQFLQRLEEAGVDPAQALRLLEPTEPLTVRSLNDQSQEELETGFITSGIGVILLLLFITMYGQWVLTGVLEEKSNRVVEVLLATLEPWQLLAGKVMGIGLLGLGQLVLLALVGYSAALVTGIAEIPAVAYGAAAAVFVWFVLGFAFYSVAYGTAGALVSRQEDAQSAATPVVMLIMASYFASFLVILPDPNSFWARLISIVPPFSPIAMPARIGVGQVAWWEFALAIVLMIGATVVMIRLAARVYAGGLLRTGARVKLREAWTSAD